MGNLKVTKDINTINAMKMFWFFFNQFAQPQKENHAVCG